MILAHSGVPYLPGDMGVTVFFVISGFIITHLILREVSATGEFDIVGFWRRRLFKIVPPLLVIIVLPSILFLQYFNLSIYDLLAQVFFYFNWLVALGTDVQVLPGSRVVWSLSIEEQFYLVFALLVLFLVTRARKYLQSWIVAISMAAVLAAPVLRLVLHGNADRIYYGTDTRVDAIALGVLVAIVLPRVLTASRWIQKFFFSWIAPTIAAGLVLVSFVIQGPADSSLRYTLHATASAIMIIYGFKCRGTLGRVWTAVATNPLVTTVGLASYSIYLAHVVIVELIAIQVNLSPIVRGILILVVGTGAGLLSYYYVERPVLSLRHKLESRSAAGR